MCLKLFFSYAVQLLTPAKIVAGINGRSTVEESDIQECATLFLDAKRSSQVLAEIAKKRLAKINKPTVPMDEN